MADNFPEDSMELTQIIVVSDMEKSKNFYHNILGAEVFREYGGTSCVLKFLENWILLVTGGGETKDKPGTQFDVPEDINRISHAMTIRVSDCQKSHEILKSRGAEFLTPPVDWGSEIRCFFRDPDGHLFEISEAN
jgi:catechol 2,3-dioxygenase-like lactoylglutathione lyase family enzyme